MTTPNFPNSGFIQILGGVPHPPILPPFATALTIALIQTLPCAVIMMLKTDNCKLNETYLKLKFDVNSTKRFVMELRSHVIEICAQS